MRWSLVLVLAACSSNAPSAPVHDPQPTPRGEGGVVVVELFTSQGCSSCPPAERLLSELARSRDDVLALAFHVDYWNHLGWADPWSSPAWSARQEAYARGRDDRLYTPALVVNGAVDVVGSRRGAVDAALAAATRVPSLAATAVWSGDAIEVTATAPDGAHAVVAVVEDGLTTEVAAGENTGVTAREDRVVRALASLDGRARLGLDPTWRREALELVVVAADPSGVVRAAARLPLPR
jgi:hypothetical protein